MQKLKVNWLAISDIGFEQVTMARPGHLLGLREESRGVEIPIFGNWIEISWFLYAGKIPEKF